MKIYTDGINAVSARTENSARRKIEKIIRSAAGNISVQDEITIEDVQFAQERAIERKRLARR